MPGNALLQSVTRALRVLELAANRREGISLGNIATGLDVGKQTAHHLVRTLIHEGFLQRVGAPPRYRAGPMLDSLTRRRDRWNRRVLMPAVPRAIRLAKETHANISVGQYVGGILIARLLVPGYDGGDTQFTFGWRFTAYGSALGYVAFLEAEEIRSYLDRHGLSADSEDYWGSRSLLHAFIREVRQHGYLAMLKAGNFRAAAPVFDGAGSVVALLSAVKPYEAMATGEADRCIWSVRRSAGQMTTRLSADTVSCG